jgi:hypothetical protein
MRCEGCGLDHASCACKQELLIEFLSDYRPATEPPVSAPGTQVKGSFERSALASALPGGDSPAIPSEEDLVGVPAPPDGSTGQSFAGSLPSWALPPSAPTQPDDDSRFSQTLAAPAGGWQFPQSGQAISKTGSTIRGPIWTVMAAVAVVALAAGGLVSKLGDHSKGPSTSGVAALATAALAASWRPRTGRGASPPSRPRYLSGRRSTRSVTTSTATRR